MLDLNNIVQGLSRSGAVSGFAGGLAGTAVAGALMGKKGRKFAKSALKLGGVAAVGGLAYAAYQRYQQGGTPSRPGPNVATQGGPLPHAAASAAGQWDHIGRERFESVIGDEPGAGPGALLLVRAMITAATADGHMDRAEQARIFDQVQRLDLSAEEKAALFDELRHPLRLDQLVAQVPDPETALEVYAASLVAIDETRPEGRAHLRDLAVALRLPDGLVASLHEEADLARRDRAA
ncbi:MAG: tellurite resistance TerB family protein [Gammaproteobacteria bacterium]|jgi:uncharacterized membrane protein YebE (DUF533 family)